MQLAETSTPQFVISADGLKLATYQWGDVDAPAVIAVHGFASSALLNWQASGWVRDLTRAGFRVIAIDQRGHGASAKPHDTASYTMAHLVGDVLTVMDTHAINNALYIGYSLGARVGWQAALDLPERITRAVLGGIPDGDPLSSFDLAGARAFIAHGTLVGDRLTETYLSMAHGIPGNDLTALVALVEGMRGGIRADPANPPRQPLLFATGNDDSVIDGSRALASAAPLGTFFEIPGRNHFNAPTSQLFRHAAMEFLKAG